MIFWVYKFFCYSLYVSFFILIFEKVQIKNKINAVICGKKVNAGVLHETNLAFFGLIIVELPNTTLPVPVM